MAETGVTKAWEIAFPAALRRKEWARIHRRRNQTEAATACENDSAAPRERQPPDQVGLALSGGGIRSATFSLGVLQALAKAKLLSKIDYLSTVSGGGYIGGFLGRIYSRDDARQQGHVEALLDPEQRARGTGSGGADAGTATAGQAKPRPVDWLRENGEYMAPDGGGDLLGLAASALRNLVAFHVVLACGLLLLLLAFKAITLATLACPWLRTALSDGWSLSLALKEAAKLQTVPSPLLDLVPAGLLLLIPAGWAYWLIERRHIDSMSPMTGFATIVGGVLVVMLAYFYVRCGGVIRSPVTGDSVLQMLLFGIPVFGMAALIALGAARLCNRGSASANESDGPDASTLFNQAAQRVWLTAALTCGLVLIGLIGGLGLIETLASELYSDGLNGAVGSGTAATAIVGPPLLQRLAGLIREQFKEVDPATIRKLLPPLFTMLAIGGFISGFAWLVALATLVEAISHGFTTSTAPAWSAMAVTAAILSLCVLAFGRTWSFVNRSSHAQVYASRLSRTFLGASNPARFDEDRVSVTEPILHDDTNMRDYHRGIAASKGPLHLINVTINQTTGTGAKTVVRDRHGIGMAVGPCGLSAGIRHHAVFDDSALAGLPDDKLPPVEWHVELHDTSPPERFSMFGPPAASRQTIRVERLTLGQWIGISGAAFSTGLGAGTSLGRSLLMGLANIRLGYWWDSGRRGAGSRRTVNLLRAALPVYAHLFDELLARFHGPQARYWYLSDGGHFENMAAYELIRRRLPMIVVVDGEEDPAYIFEGFGNLVRKARLDFGAEITVVPAEQRATLVHSKVAGLFGELADLRTTPDAPSKCRAVLCRVDYLDGQTAPSTLLYIKPTVLASDPADIHHYRVQNPAFPQQPTFDQFFDEAQWESYRKLGQIVGDALFGPELAKGETAETAGFLPSTLKRVANSEPAGTA